MLCGRKRASDILAGHNTHTCRHGASSAQVAGTSHLVPSHVVHMQQQKVPCDLLRRFCFRPGRRSGWQRANGELGVKLWRRPPCWNHEGRGSTESFYFPSCVFFFSPLLCLAMPFPCPVSSQGPLVFFLVCLLGCCSIMPRPCFILRTVHDTLPPVVRVVGKVLVPQP